VKGNGTNQVVLEVDVDPAPPGRRRRRQGSGAGGADSVAGEAERAQALPVRSPGVTRPPGSTHFPV
jgi:hypothetical protein